MDVTVNLLGVGGIVILAILIGYFIGRSERRELHREEEETEGRRIPIGKSIASPVSGEVSFFCEDSKKGAVIEPEQNMVYAPISGKIIKLYPMGNAFVLRSDEHSDPTELLIQVGRNTPDELCSMYYRPHIIQNEIVNRGKLLLTFDKERLQAAGADVAVIVSLEEGIETRDVKVTQKGSVKVGDELMWVKENE